VIVSQWQGVKGLEYVWMIEEKELVLLLIKQVANLNIKQAGNANSFPFPLFHWVCATLHSLLFDHSEANPQTYYHR
jgi:hypothetical protein